jgi:hypothetical protein
LLEQEQEQEQEQKLARWAAFAPEQRQWRWRQGTEPLERIF